VYRAHQKPFKIKQLFLNQKWISFQALHKLVSLSSNTSRPQYFVIKIYNMKNKIRQECFPVLFIMKWDGLAEGWIARLAQCLKTEEGVSDSDDACLIIITCSKPYSREELREEDRTYHLLWWYDNLLFSSRIASLGCLSSQSVSVVCSKRNKTSWLIFLEEVECTFLPHLNTFLYLRLVLSIGCSYRVCCMYPS